MPEFLTRRNGTWHFVRRSAPLAEDEVSVHAVAATIIKLRVALT
jgi:hypothetical protein